jgi:cytoskeletal protein CcmA (bactofilin family)
MLFGRNKKNQPPAPPRPPAVDPSFIGRNCYFEGQISCEGELHIDGQVRGEVRAALCVVDKHGIVFGNISGEVVHVRGRVTGPIQGGSVFIYAGAHIEGDVFNEQISVEPGAFVDGAIRRNPARQKNPQQSNLPDLKSAAKSLRIVASDK